MFGHAWVCFGCLRLGAFRFAWICVGLLRILCWVCLGVLDFARVCSRGVACACWDWFGLAWSCLALFGFAWLSWARLLLELAWASGASFVLLERGLKFGRVLYWIVLSCLLLPRLTLPCRVSPLVLAVWSVQSLPNLSCLALSCRVVPLACRVSSRRFDFSCRVWSCLVLT